MEAPTNAYHPQAMKHGRNFWPVYREGIVKAMRYFGKSPDGAQYAVRYGNAARTDSDTYKLAEKVLAEAKRDNRKHGKPLTVSRP